MERDTETPEKEQKEASEKGEEMSADEVASAAVKKTVAALNADEKRRLSQTEFYFTYDVSEQIREQQDIDANEGQAAGEKIIPEKERQSPKQRTLSECDLVKVWGRAHFDVYKPFAKDCNFAVRSYWSEPELLGVFPSHITRISEIEDPNLIRLMNHNRHGVQFTRQVHYYLRHANSAANGAYALAERNTVPPRLVMGLNALLDVCENDSTFREWDMLREENPEIISALLTLLESSKTQLEKRLSEVESEVDQA